MIRASGLFIVIMGIGVVLGAVFQGRRRLLLTLGAAVATLVIILFAARLSEPFGPPTRTQLWFLFGAIAAEVFLVRLAVALYREAGERSLLLAIRFAVGLHFLPMAVALGPVCALMGATLCACSGVGLWVRPNLTLNGLWAADGVIKTGFGAAMLLVA